MQFDASVFFRRIEGIRAAINKLDEGTQTLSRGVTLLRQHVPAGRHVEHQYLEAMDAAIFRMMASHDMVLEAVGKFVPSSGKLVLPPARSPLDALCNAAATLAVIRNAMDMLANDPEGSKNLAPWQRELFTKSYAHIAGVVETLYEAHKELRREKDLET